jgi:hypothetical protein
MQVGMTNDHSVYVIDVVICLRRSQLKRQMIVFLRLAYHNVDVNHGDGS